MPGARRAVPGVHLALAVASLSLALAGCGRGSLSPPDATYTTRGQVIELPAAAGGDLTLHHETVADFRARDGKTTHMDSMSMPFAVAPNVSLDGIATGDKVDVTFEVRWEGGPPLRITRLEELPADTALVFGGPTLELVAPLGSGKPAPAPAEATPAPSASPSATDRPATDGPAAPPPSSTI
jgi:Cu/Ag efflux protein CusF